MDVLDMRTMRQYNRFDGYGDTMKVNRTYSMDYDLVIKLAKKVNQSKEVCIAVRKHLDGQDDFSLRDVPVMQLLATLQSRFDQYDPEYSLIQTLIAMCRPS